MPAQHKPSALQAKYGNRTSKTIAETSTAPIEYGRQDLPPGIKNGRARLEKAYFGEFKTGDNKGEMFLYLEGTVVEPYSVMLPDGREIVVEGGATKQILPYCATKGTKPKSQADNVKILVNEIKKLGGEEFLKGVANEAQLEARVAQLEQAHPYFAFETRQGSPTPQYPNPRTFESWFGSRGLENYEPGQTGGVDDATQASTAPSKNGAAASTTGGTDTASAGFDEFGDLASLVELASQEEESNERDEAQVSLQDMARSAGISDDQIAEAPTWQYLADLISGGSTAADGGEAEEQEEQEETPPVLKKVYKFHPIDPKTKKPGKKTVEVSVLSIDKEAKTARCKSVENPKVIYDKVTWDALSDAD